MEFDDGEPVPEVEGIPLADDLPAETAETESRRGKQRRRDRVHPRCRRDQKSPRSPRQAETTTPSPSSSSSSISTTTTDRVPQSPC